MPEIHNVLCSELSTFLSSQPVNTPTTPYHIYLMGLNEWQDVLTVKSALLANLSKYCYLSYVSLPTLTDYTGAFSGCYNLIASPLIPTDFTGVVYDSMFEGCTYLKEAQANGSELSVSSAKNMFRGCESIEYILFSMRLFGDARFDYMCSRCLSLKHQINIIKNSGNEHINTSYCYNQCQSLEDYGYVMPWETNATGKYLESGITMFVINQEGVSDYMLDYVCRGCTSLEKVFIDSHVTIFGFMEAFKNCTSLKTVNWLNTSTSFLGSANVQNCFQGCTSLEAFELGGAYFEQNDWKVYRIKVDSNTISGKVYENGTIYNITSAEVGKSDFITTFDTDELLFSSTISDADLDSLIEDVLEYKYPYTTKECVNPKNKSFVLWAVNPDNVVTNLPFVKTSDVTSTVSSGNSQPVTSGGVAEAIAGQSGFVSEINMTAVGWIKVCSIQNWDYGDILELYFTSDWASGGSSAKKITIAKGVTSGGGGFASWVTVKEEASDPAYLLSSVQVCGANSTEETDKVFIYVYYNRAGSNTIRMSYKQSGKNSPTVYMTKETPSGYALTASYSLHTSGVFVNGSNVFMQRWGTVYSGSLYNSGYFLLAQAGQYYASIGNHDVGIHGTVDFCPASNHVSIEFDIFVRGNGNSVQRQMFTCLVVGGNNSAGFKDILIATVEAINNTFIVRLYATIVGYWGRFNINITKFWLGDVQQLSDMYNSNFIVLPLTRVDTLAGTTITRTALN